MDKGVAASIRRVVNRTARLCTKGSSMIASRLAIKKPMATYMIGSIMSASRPFAVTHITLTRGSDGFQGHEPFV
jgi:hypothetical protein